MKRESDRDRLQAVVVGLLLAGLTLGVYAQVIGFEFVGWDDDRCVYAHPVVSQGWSWQGAAWVFANPICAGWTPLAWLSHMLDIEFFGQAAGGHHAVSLFFHLLNTLLLFGLLRSLTGTLWRSACVAALFAVHPLHVESVAWIAERRDVLSTAFGLGCLWFYVRWTRGGRASGYALACVCLALGLMSKSMLVTLPLLLLLLDYWPLERLGSPRHPPTPGPAGAALLARRILEKLPLFALAAMAAAANWLAQSRHAIMPDTQSLSFFARVGNALVSYLLYLWKTLWPRDLAAFYPHPSLPGGPEPWNTIEVGTAALALTAVTWFALRMRRHPYLIVGWLWYLIALVPVIGLVQVGKAAIADRYTYLPHIGIFVALVWGVWGAIAIRRWRQPRPAIVAGCLAVLAVASLALLSWRQVGTWRDSTTLFAHAVSVTDGNYTMHFNLGNEYQRLGDVQRAREHYQQALAIYPEMAKTHLNLAELLHRAGLLDEAIHHFRQAARYRPWDSRPMMGLVEAGRARDGNLAVVIDFLRERLEEFPDSADLHVGLGNTLLKDGQVEAAIASYQRSLELDPDSAKVREQLDTALRARDDDSHPLHSEHLGGN